MGPHFYVRSAGDSHVMLVSTFATDITHLGTMKYPTTTTRIHFTVYYTPSDRQWVTCHAELFTVPLYLSSESGAIFTHFISSNGISSVMLVSTFATDVTHPATIGYPTATTHIYFTT